MPFHQDRVRGGTGAPAVLCAAALALASCAESPPDHPPVTQVSARRAFAPTVAQASAPGGHRLVGAQLGPIRVMSSPRYQLTGGLTP